MLTPIVHTVASYLDDRAEIPGAGKQTRSLPPNGRIITDDRVKRFVSRGHTAHNGETFATSHRGPLRLIYYEAYTEREDAEGREKFLEKPAAETRKPGKVQ